jgi:hypothetical protein
MRSNDPNSVRSNGIGTISTVKVITITPAQQKRLGKLLSLGVPLVVALPIAMAEPEEVKEAQARATDILQVPGDIISGKKRKRSAYSRKYSAAFKKMSSKFKNKNGTWRKGGFKAAVKAAHKAVKK